MPAQINPAQIIATQITPDQIIHAQINPGRFMLKLHLTIFNLTYGTPTDTR